MRATRALVDARHRARQQAIAEAVAVRLAGLLVVMPDLGEEALAGYVAEAYPTVAGGQTVAADTAADYMTLLAARPPRRPPDLDKALLRSGVLVEPDSRSLVAPVLRARHLVAEGEHEVAAVRTAANYAGQLSSADLQAAMRVGVDEGARAAELKVHGWRKAPVGGACKWCRSIADNSYDDPDSVPYHEGDRCGVEPDLTEPPPLVFDDSDIPF